MKCEKAISMISSGIDSPVASWMMIEKGMSVIGLHCSNSPLDASKSKEITIKHCKKIGIHKLYVVQYGKYVQELIAERCYSPFACVLCKRFMVRIAAEIAKREGCCCIITGDNLGQVASQTLENMAVVSQVTALPIIRPLLCNDKQETIDIARKIGTYDIGLEKHPPCPFVPKNPVTKSTAGKIDSEERKLDIERMVSDAIDHSEVLDI